MTDTTTGTGKTTRAQRMALPLARDVVRDLAVEHGACIRPVQLRHTNLNTGEAETVLVPCGHTLAHVCPACAERAKSLRAAQCRKGWHLEDEPDTAPDPATEDQKWWIEKRAEAQQLREQAEVAGQDTTDLDELVGQQRTVKAKVASQYQPVLPEAPAGSPFVPVEFEGLAAMPWVDDLRARAKGKCTARLAYSLKATRGACPVAAARPSGA